MLMDEFHLLCLFLPVLFIRPAHQSILLHGPLSQLIDLPFLRPQRGPHLLGLAHQLRPLLRAPALPVCTSIFLTLAVAQGPPARVYERRIQLHALCRRGCELRL